MFSAEMRKLIFEVITSWQVLFVTGAFILFVFLVNHVARVYRKRPSTNFSARKTKGKKGGAAEAPPSGESDDLGVEENVIEE